MNKPIRVLVVDDSALVRKLLTEILQEDPGIEVVGAAMDAFVAREKIKQLSPDVLTLDVEMPRMDGVTFLGNLMRLRPMPVIMVSSLTAKGAEVTLRALELGAVDFITKPGGDLVHGLKDYSAEIIAKVKVAACAKVRTYNRSIVKPMKIEAKLSADAVLERISRKGRFATTDSIIAIGASTGGTEAIKEVLMAMPANSPATVITQHIPADFSGPFAERVNGVSAMTVCEAKDGQPILAGHAYIAPGDRHLIVVRYGAQYHCKLSDGPAVNRHKPSVDVLFRSVAQTAGPNAVGVLLTGMGDDGAKGLKEMQEAGARTIAQDENSSVVWGMPKAAVALGAADTVLPLEKIASSISMQLPSNKKFNMQPYRRDVG
ncbi:MAG: chemotaxis response regulator protein-glutamate methylesterase [SAR86 cluster bacterium]|uniref:Protein-glutamate methylesterase/protein-glutamine glutaminase n=1 Tax=SAR86 cluster bacterium TaxID=2030880 RepID=A0A2A5AYM3_9GAMM|nr:MAG: chemotaxis response regulator protein-glutamate methylesterase [SAR86 cluster bacterium]